ncbi:MAG TPA: hypothetical protein VF980_01945 [Thermoanaerobaculia bacterium]
MRSVPIALVLTLGLIACSSPSITPMTVPLQYKTMANPAEFPAAQNCAIISRVDVTDNRPDTTLGNRYLQEKQSTRAAVTASGDVAAWLRSGVEAALRQGGVVMRSNGPVLRVSLDNIKTDESVYRRAQYSGRLSLTADLVSSSGKSCWHDSVEGYSENYGYAGSAENYQETLNHALDRAMIRILGSGEFKRASCNCS